MRFPFNNRGFGLIELMVSIVIGLIVIAGITSLVVATLRANTENMQMTRLTQEMRSVMQLTTRDLRRAGYDQNAVRDFGSGGSLSNDFAQVRAFDSGGNEKDLTAGIATGSPATCVLFSYDDNNNGTAEANEFRGYKLNTNNNSIEAKTSGSAADADCSAGNWETLTDAATVNVNEFSITTENGDPVPVVTDSTGNPVLTVRTLVFRMDAELINDTSVQRSVRETVRVRNDLLN